MVVTSIACISYLLLRNNYLNICLSSSRLVQAAASWSWDSQLTVPDVEVLFRSLLATHLPMSSWLKEVTWPSPDSLWEGGPTGRGYREAT